MEDQFGVLVKIQTTLSQLVPSSKQLPKIIEKCYLLVQEVLGLLEELNEKSILEKKQWDIRHFKEKSVSVMPSGKL